MKKVIKEEKLVYKNYLRPYKRITYNDGTFDWENSDGEEPYPQSLVDKEEEYDLSPSLEELEQLYQNLEDNPVPSLDNLDVNDIANIKYALEQVSIIRGLSGDAYAKILKKLESVRTSNKEQLKKELTIVLPNSFFHHHGINPESMDGYHCNCEVNGEIVYCHLIEKAIDKNGKKRYSYLG